MDKLNKKIKKLETQFEEQRVRMEEIRDFNHARVPTLQDIENCARMGIQELPDRRYIVREGDRYTITTDRNAIRHPSEFIAFYLVKKPEDKGKHKVAWMTKDEVHEYTVSKKYLAY